MLRIHFLNVGHGDCTLIRHPSGRLTMIDINNSQQFDADTFKEELAEERSKNRFSGSSLIGDAVRSYIDTATVEARAKDELEDPIEFVKNNYPGEKIWRFVLTHPDLDHMRGLAALEDNVGIINFWDTNHTKETPEFRTDADRDDWQFYQSIRNNQVGMHVKYFTRGASAFAFNFPEGDCIEILSPTPELVTECNRREVSNDISLVLRAHHGGRSVLLPGDAESLAWADMRKAYGAKLKSDFLKASHHGRESGYDADAVKMIAPLMTFVSVGQAPATDASRKYRQATGNKSASTRRYGNIELRIEDDGRWSWFVDKHAGE